MGDKNVSKNREREREEKIKSAPTNTYIRTGDDIVEEEKNK